MTTPDVPADRIDVGLIRPFAIVAAVVGVVSLFVFTAEVQDAEAALSARVVAILGVADARSAGNTVLFATAHGLAGYGVSLGCTVSLLLAPFVLVTVGLLSVARVSVRRATASLLVAILVISAVNQLRLLVIAAAMHAWGAHLGYSRTHLLLGSLISTLGLVLAGVAYLAVLLGGQRDRQATDHG